MWEAVSAALGLVVMIVGYLLKKEKTQAEKAREAADQASKAVLKMRRKIHDGKLMDVQEDLDAIDFRIRALLQLREKKRSS